MSIKTRVERLEKRAGDTAQRFESVYVGDDGVIWRDATRLPITAAELSELRNHARVYVTRSNIEYERL